MPLIILSSTSELEMEWRRREERKKETEWQGDKYKKIKMDKA